MEQEIGFAAEARGRWFMPDDPNRGATDEEVRARALAAKDDDSKER